MRQGVGEEELVTIVTVCVRFSVTGIVSETLKPIRARL